MSSSTDTLPGGAIAAAGGGGGGGGGSDGSAAATAVATAASAMATLPEECAGASASSASGFAERPRKRPRTNMATVRLQKDYLALQDEPANGCSAAPITEDSMLIWRASIIGPDESPFEGGVFQLRMVFGDEYPLKPPKVSFVTEVFHPNVYVGGDLCLDILQDAWSPVQTVGSVLTSIRSLLDDPNIASPANVDAAKMYRDDLRGYKRRVRKMVAAMYDS